MVILLTAQDSEWTPEKLKVTKKGKEVLNHQSKVWVDERRKKEKKQKKERKKEEENLEKRLVTIY